MAHIALIPKPAKDPTDCASLATRLTVFLPKLIGEGAVGVYAGAGSS